MHPTVAHHGAAASKPLARLTMLVALGALLSTSWRCLRESHHKRIADRPNTKPEKLQVWEDEGGQNQMPDKPAP
ncbi:MAG TPA: hypothetical protein VI032_19765 [Burkholderiaceae bacterium]